jgi:hypothetical protein
MSQLRAMGLQKGRLLKLLLALPLKDLPLALDIGRRIKQAMGILLGQLVGPALIRKLASRRVIFQTRPSASS